MQIQKKEENGSLTVMVEGWLDVESTATFEQYMSELSETKSLVFDFEKLEYISSSGVRAVVAAYRRQKDIGGAFEVINVSPEVLDVFNMTGLCSKIKISGK